METYFELDDDGNDDWEDDRIDLENICDCGRSASDNCGFCGNPLCYIHFELGAGFCKGPHTREQVAEYAKDHY